MKGVPVDEIWLVPTLLTDSASHLSSSISPKRAELVGVLNLRLQNEGSGLLHSLFPLARIEEGLLDLALNSRATTYPPLEATIRVTPLARTTPIGYLCDLTLKSELHDNIPWKPQGLHLLTGHSIESDRLVGNACSARRMTEDAKL